MPLFRSSPQTKRALIFHVGSSAIIGAHVLFDTKSDRTIPEITKSTIVPISLTHDRGIEQLIRSMKKSLREAGERLVKESIGNPEEIICFLESPWYAAQVRTIKVAKHVPFLVTEKLVQDLIKKEMDLFERDTLRGSSGVIIEREITDIKANGYPVDSIYGKKVKELALGLVVSVSPRELLTHIQDEIGHVFHRKDVRFRTFAHAGSMITRDLFITTNQFLFVDIGGEVTDIIVVKDNMYAETISFPWGTNTFYRFCSEKLGLPLSETQNEISLYLSGSMHGTHAAKLERRIEPLLVAWADSFGTSLEKIAHQFALPHTIALLTEPPLLSPLFKAALENETRVQHTLTQQGFTVVELVDVPWRDFARHDKQPHPRGAIAALLVAKYMDNKI